MERLTESGCTVLRIRQPWNTKTILLSEEDVIDMAEQLPSIFPEYFPEAVKAEPGEPTYAKLEDHA